MFKKNHKMTLSAWTNQRFLYVSVKNNKQISEMITPVYLIITLSMISIDQSHSTMLNGGKFLLVEEIGVPTKIKYGFKWAHLAMVRTKLTNHSGNTLTV